MGVDAEHARCVAFRDVSPAFLSLAMGTGHLLPMEVANNNKIIIRGNIKTLKDYFVSDVIEGF